MKPAVFDYQAPRTVEGVIELLREHGAEARVLAGGQSLVPMLNLRVLKPAVLIDLNRCEPLSYVRREGDWIAVGAMARQLDTMDDPLVRKHCPLVSKAIEHAGPVAVRSRATVGGTIAHADRVAELPVAAMTLDAMMVIDGINGRRTVPANAFFVADLTTAIVPGEFLCEVRFPVCAAHAISTFQEVSVRQEGVAVVGLASYIVLDAGAVSHIALTAMGVDGCPVRLHQTEALVREQGLDAEGLIEAAMACARAEIDPSTDPYATAAYRTHTVGVLVQRALRGAIEQRTA